MKNGSSVNFWFVESRNWFMIHRSWTLNSYSETAPIIELNGDPLPQEQIQQKENGVNVKQVLERPNIQAARLSRDKLKEMFSDEIGTFACCQECHSDHSLLWKNQWKLLETS